MEVVHEDQDRSDTVAGRSGIDEPCNPAQTGGVRPSCFDANPCCCAWQHLSSWRSCTGTSPRPTSTPSAAIPSASNPHHEDAVISNEELAAWLAGEADPAVAAQVESALPDDLALAGRLDEIRQADSLLAAMPASPAPSEAAIQRITAAAMRAANDHLDFEAAHTAEAAARSNRGSGLAGVMGRAGTSPSGRGEPRMAGHAGSSDDPGNWWRRIDWSGWPFRLAAAFGVVALVGVGVGVERLASVGGGQDATTMAADQMDDQAEAEGLAPELDNSAGGADVDDNLERATEAAAAEQAPDEAEAGLAQGQGEDGSTAASEETLNATRPLKATISDAQWAELVADDVPTILVTPDGDVGLLAIGTRFEVLVSATTIGASGRDPFDEAFRSPPLQVASTTVQQWIDDVMPLASTIDSSVFDATDDVRSGPELARDCVARRSLAVADLEPPAPGVVAVLAGIGQPSASPWQALVDADGGIVVVDAVTCDPV